MLVSEFKEMCQLYEGFQIWEVENIAAFFEGNAVLSEIFSSEYGMAVEEMAERRSEIEDTDMRIIINLLSLIGDKSFFVFTLHDDNHLELVGMQKMKVMDFGVDIQDIKNDRVYVMIMDKKK